MGGGTPRKSYTKIKNFTEKDQVRVKYSHIGKDKKLMLSVYIGEEVYNELTGGQKYERLKVEYIPNDMVIITPTDNEKEGIVHRYNGKGLFKTTCVRLSLSSYKKLKIRKKDFNNRVVEYEIWWDTANIYGCNRLMVNLIGNKKESFVFTDPVQVHKEFVDLVKSTEVDTSIPDQLRAGLEAIRKNYEDDDSMFVSHDFLNDVRDAIENRLLDTEERFEKRIQTIESLLKEFMDQPLHPLKADKGNSLKQLLGKATDEMNIRFSKAEKELAIINSRLGLFVQINDPDYISYHFREIKDLLNEIKKSHGNKSLMKKIFGKD